ncbi:MAG: SusD/RagB family nutrient-binding outer membrane lipoprotein [Candidatus Pedobacter colombiensis]|uniref:SusD/RagB family nutrient-binding outer membrane lipoprotein n=1 Tax=Candidatus Pedobacter colombiensis TaxID=3121371 RepID=A0AAJ6B618_9SPHI|nr:SusD/RagB family nutrient-binding outer membrane lipoprotein [Pedobacter sp.]WEK19397.1 MAG: SusD/RagB family nutrient-binding outer membrane lipoprotein [Pedobacter sp.]
MQSKYIFNPRKLLLLVLIGAVGFTGCKKFLDINQNPNNPDTADPTLLLPTVEAAVSQIVGNGYQVFGGIWSQYWTQSPTASQYRTIDQYNLANTAFDRNWLTLYRSALINAQIIINNNTVAGVEYTKGIAYILKAYATQLTTDGFGDIPLGQALQGATFISPQYQSQQSVYDSIFVFIDKGVGLLKTPTATNPGAQDMIFQGGLAQWIAFANTLKLRAYLRIAYIDPAKAQAGIQALYATNPTFVTADATIKYTTIGGNENPLYNEMVALNRVQNLVASKTVVSAFIRNADVRRFKFYDLLKDSTEITSIPQGNYLNSPIKLVSPPSALVGGNSTNTSSATAPVKLISATESLFLQAEAVARGWAPNGGDLETLIKNGVNASFVATGLAIADGTNYYAAAPDGHTAFVAATTVEAKVQVIITQKYYAMCGFQGFEAWSEWRRTGYPTFFVKSIASLLGGLKAPLRFLYPNTELTTNANYPGTQPLSVNVWWGKNLQFTQ